MTTIGNLLARGIKVPPFYAGQMAQAASRLAQSGREVIPMHFGQPALGPPDGVLDAARRALDLGSDVLGYWESDKLKARIAGHYRERYGVSVAPERVLLTSGASAGLVAIFTAMFRSGDRIALPRPGYPAWRNALHALQRTVLELDCGPESAFRLTARQIAAVPTTIQGLVVASPANPTGAVIERTELHEIAAVCRARGIRMISDEVYHGISYGAQTATALEIEPDAIVVNSFSKLFRMPGWRLGWIVVPEPYIDHVQSHLVNLLLTPPALSQHAALAAFNSPEDLQDAHTMYARNREILLAGLPQAGFRNITPPEGAFYIYADVSQFTEDSFAYCRKLLNERGVAITPGIDFDTKNGMRYVRFSFAASTSQIERGLELLLGKSLESNR